jgi:tyrosinase
MSNPISSPGDPLFYLHHTWLDKIWWDWQKQNLSVRLTEMGGPNRPQARTATPGTRTGGPGGNLPEQRPDDVPYVLIPFTNSSQGMAIR